MHPKTLLVTGGAGFIGSDFIRLALENGSKVIVLDALTYAGKRENIAGLDCDLVVGSITNADIIAQILKTHHPDAIVHFAAESHVDNSIAAPNIFMETNITGTMTLLEQVRAHCDLNNFRFVHVSTDEVYGDLPLNAPPANENTAYAPSSPYAASKAASDHLVRAWQRTYGVPAIITNCTNNYGPRQLPEKLIPLCLTRALAGENLPIYGDGSALRDWIYVRDHTQGVWDALTKGEIGESYGFSGNMELNTVQVVDALCAILDRKKPRPDGTSYSTLKTFVPDRAGHDYRYALSSKKAQSTLGWSQKHDFTDALQTTIDWYLNKAQKEAA